MGANLPRAHLVQMGVVVFFHEPAGQSSADARQRPVTGSHIVPAPQSAALSGHNVAGSSALLLMQQHRRVRHVSEAVQEEVPDDRAKHAVPYTAGQTL